MLCVELGHELADGGAGGEQVSLQGGPGNGRAGAAAVGRAGLGGVDLAEQVAVPVQEGAVHGCQRRCGCGTTARCPARWAGGADIEAHLPAPRGARDGGDAVVRGETGDQTDQESRSAGHRAAPSVTAMDITIHATFLPHDDPDASLAFYRDTLGFEVRNDVGYGGMRWITVGPADQPGTSISGLPVRL